MGRGGLPSVSSLRREIVAGFGHEGHGSYQRLVDKGNTPFSTLFHGLAKPLDFHAGSAVPTTHSPLLHPTKTSSRSVASLAALCQSLDITQLEFDEARNLTAAERYKKHNVPKRDGSSRAVFNPHYLIRKIQRRINRRIFANPNIITWPDHVFGSIPNTPQSASNTVERDYVNCARQHCGSKSILSADIKDFFDNIHQEQVAAIFKDFLKYPKEVSEALANICCLDSHLAQGALTSSYLATLCLFKTEGDLVKKLKHKGLTYTRLVDDITISSKISNYDFGYALKQTEQMLNDAGLPLNPSKTAIQYASMNPLIVHGLRVDFDQPRLPPQEPKKIRAAVKNLELLAATPGYRTTHAYRKDFNRCMGRVNKLHRVKHNSYPALLARLRKILPLPSHTDINIAEKMVERLEKDYKKSPDYKNTYWFYKRYYTTNERLTILKRCFPKKAEELRIMLKSMRPASKYE